MIIISGALSDVLVVVWWLDIVFFHYDKLHMLLKVGAPGRTHNVYSENSCSELCFHYALLPILPTFISVYFFLFFVQVCFRDLVGRVSSLILMLKLEA